MIHSFHLFWQQVTLMTFTQALSRITLPSPQAAQAARDRMARMGGEALAALGTLGEYPALLAGCTREPKLLLDKRTLVVTASEGFGREKSREALAQAAARQGALGIALTRTGCGILGVDLTPGAPPLPGVLARPLETQGDTLSRVQLTQTLNQGVELAQMLWQRGTRLALLSTAAPAPVRVAALTAKLTRRPLHRLGEGEVFSQAQALVEERRPNRRFYSLLEGLATPDIAFLVGVMVGFAARQVPVCPDGGDALAAAALASLASPHFASCCFCLEAGADPVNRALAELLEGRPLTCTGTRLGCGYGALTALPLLDGLTHLYHSLAPSACPYPQRPTNVFH